MKIGKISIATSLWLFIVIIAIYMFMTFLGQFLQTREILFNTFGSAEFVEKMLRQQQKYGWITYLIIPVIYALKFLLITAVLNIGVLLLNLKIRFRQLWRVVLRAEFAPIVFAAITLALMFYNSFQTLDEIDQYNPFSLSYYINTANIPELLMAPLSLLNLAELAYWLLLARLMMPLLGKKFFPSLGFVAQTYGVGLLVWITLMVFLSLMLF